MSHFYRCVAVDGDNALISAYIGVALMLRNLSVYVMLHCMYVEYANKSRVFLPHQIKNMLNFVIIGACDYAFNVLPCFEFADNIE